MGFQFAIHSLFQELLKQWGKHTMLIQHRYALYDPAGRLLFESFEVKGLLSLISICVSFKVTQIEIDTLFAKFADIYLCNV